jgi:putative flippase GtrA
MSLAENDLGVPLQQREPGWLFRLAARLPRPLRFMGVGGFCLLVDLAAFTLLIQRGMDPLLARFIVLCAATVLAWRLNRLFTFERTGRHQGHEAMRYAIVTATAQGTSYAVFAALVLTVLGGLPQAALIAGAAVGAIVSYNGHRLFAFAPHIRPAASASEGTAS